MSRFCVIAGTKITLNNGKSLPIEKIKAGEEVLSFDLNTLQRSQKYDVLVKLKTNDFKGVIKKDIVKNIWKNTAEEYFAINDKLKITGDHIVLAKRDNTYYWTKVVNLNIGDYLFTEFNIFEKIETIILIKGKVKVFNLEVNSIYNYFADSYLIHNGAPCSACAACGQLTQFAFSDTHWLADNNWEKSTTTTLSSLRTSFSSEAEEVAILHGGRYSNPSDSGISLTSAGTSFSTNLIPGTPQYSARILLPILNTTDSAEIWFKVISLGGGYTTNNHFGIGIVHKFTAAGNTPASANASWTIDHNSKYLNITAGSAIFNDAKMVLRLSDGQMTFTNTINLDPKVAGSSQTAQPGGHGNGQSSATGTHYFGGSISSTINENTVVANSYIGMKVTQTTGVTDSDATLKFMIITNPSSSMNIISTEEKPIPNIFRNLGSTNTSLSSFNGNNFDEGAWAFYVFDSTSNSNTVHLEVIEPQS